MKIDGERLGLCDTNSKRVRAARKIIGVESPTFTDLNTMLCQTKPQLLIVTTRDAVQHEQIGFNDPILAFDLVNWCLDAEPVEVFAMVDLKHYGRNGKVRGEKCRGCANQAKCQYYWDIDKDTRLKALYVDCESEDGYLRDACVYRQDINIYDTMTAQVRYTNGALMAYSVPTFMPIEGYHLAFNGSKGRLELRQYERQSWKTPQAVARREGA